LKVKLIQRFKGRAKNNLPGPFFNLRKEKAQAGQREKIKSSDKEILAFWV